MPIHYVSRSLQGGETNYAPMEKLALALVHTARRLRRYFQAHPIKVITDSPIGQVLNNSGVSGRLAKWVVELGAYGITYVPRVSLKGHVLADFLADTSTEINATPEVASTPRMEDILEFWITHIPRAENRKVDALSKLAAVQFDHLSKEVLVEVLNDHSIKAQEVNMVVEEEGPTWMTLIRNYLEKGVMPKDLADARILMEKIGNYIMEDGVLYRKSYLVPLMRLPKAYMISVTSACPFMKWGMDIVGPLPEGPGRVKFRIPATIITDNGTRFLNDPFKKWAEKLIPSRMKQWKGKTEAS
ncbi:reverse transcriptase domain-containing protein [Tanacetum coccineum]